MSSVSHTEAQIRSALVTIRRNRFELADILTDLKRLVTQVLCAHPTHIRACHPVTHVFIYRAFTPNPPLALSASLNPFCRHTVVT